MGLSKSNTDSLTVLAAAVAGMIQIMSTPGRFTLSSITTGVILMSILSTYHVTHEQNNKELVALSVVWGLAIVITIGVGIEYMNDYWVRKILTKYPELRLNSRLDEYIGILREGVQLIIWLLFSIGAFIIAHVKRKRARIRESEFQLLGKPN
jgi:hypothetical protein